jgi:UPF0176 protein
MTETRHWFATTFYRFLAIENPDQVKILWDQKAAEFGLCGLLILGKEGFNTTCAATSKENLESFKSWVTQTFNCGDMLFKDSVSDVEPFQKFKSKVRTEIVTLGVPELIPDNANHRHLTPDEWNKAMAEEGTVIIDTRNFYEYRIGTFKNAINPNIEQFTEFPEFFEKQQFEKDKKILIFCTGGIRCEKGILDLEKAGYENVYQLEGGILNYLEQKPNDKFEGECFVFDSRIALDQKLQPTKVYRLCPHCGQPGELPKTCIRCDSEFIVCVTCEPQDIIGQVCSKNCAHHAKRHPGRKGAKQVRASSLRP